MILPVLAIAIGAFITGDFSNHEIARTSWPRRRVLRRSATFFNQFALVMVWLYIIGWSTYGPEAGATFAPEYKDTRTTRARPSPVTGGVNVLLAILLPIAVLGTIGYDGILADAFGVSVPRRRPARDRGRGLRDVPSRLPLRWPAPVDEHGHDGRLEGALRALRGEDDDQAARRPEQAQRAGARHDRRHAPERVPGALLPEHLLHPGGGQPGLHVLARARPLRRAAAPKGPADLAATDQAREALDGRGGRVLHREPALHHLRPAQDRVHYRLPLGRRVHRSSRRSCPR